MRGQKLIFETATLNNRNCPVVDASRLYIELKLSKTGFSRWFKRTCARLNLIQDQDWTAQTRIAVGQPNQRRHLKLVSLPACLLILQSYEGGRLSEIKTQLEEIHAEDQAKQRRENKKALTTKQPTSTQTPAPPSTDPSLHPLPQPKLSDSLIEVKTELWDGKEVATVDARELFRFLESKRGFANWFQKRVEDYGFIEGQDYQKSLLNKFVQQTNRGGHNKKDYSLTLDMAKELSMVERNKKGRQARKYFIDCEKQLYLLKETPSRPAPIQEVIQVANRLCETLEKLMATDEPLN